MKESVFEWFQEKRRKLGWRYVRVEAIVYDFPRTIKSLSVDSQGFTIIND